MERRSFFLATAAAASLLVACASILGIDDVTVRDAGGAGDGGSSSDAIDEKTSPLSDADLADAAPVEIDAGPCKVCSGVGETTACALACDMPGPSALVLDDTGSFVFFTNGGVGASGLGSSAWKVNVAGGVAPVLLEDAGTERPNAIAYAPLRKVVLYGLPGANAIHVSDGGAAGASSWSNAASPGTIAVAPGANGGLVFYKSVNALETTNVDNPAGVTPYIGEPVNDFSVNAVAGKIGWTTAIPSNAVLFSTASTAGGTVVASAQSNAVHVALTSGADPTTYAWSTDRSGGGAEIHSHGTGSTTSTTLWSGQSVGGMQLATDDTSLYFTDTIAGTVSLIANDAPAQVIASSQDSPGGIAVGSAWVVWVDRGSAVNASGRVMRIGR